MKIKYSLIVSVFLKNCDLIGLSFDQPACCWIPKNLVGQLPVYQSALAQHGKNAKFLKVIKKSYKY